MCQIGLTFDTLWYPLGLRAIADGFPKLRWLNLKNLRLVTDIGVKHLAMGCKDLSHLDLSGELSLHGVAW